MSATSGSGSGSPGLNIDIFNGSGSGIDVPDELVSSSCEWSVTGSITDASLIHFDLHSSPVVSSSLPWPSSELCVHFVPVCD